MATGPKVAETPLELLAPVDREEPLLNYVWGPLVGGTLGFVGISLTNFLTRRPIFSGIQRHIGAALVGGLACKWLDDTKRSKMALRDAIYRHYIELHPEDFPPFDRKKYSELLEPWMPIR